MVKIKNKYLQKLKAIYNNVYNIIIIIITGFRGVFFSPKFHI